MSKPVLVNDPIADTDVIRLTARIGAEIRNVRLAGDLAPVTIEAINTLMDWMESFKKSNS